MQIKSYTITFDPTADNSSDYGDYRELNFFALENVWILAAELVARKISDWHVVAWTVEGEGLDKTREVSDWLELQRKRAILNDMRRRAADNRDLPCDQQERPYRFSL